MTASELTTLTPLAIIIKLFNLRMFQTIRGLVHAGRFFETASKSKIIKTYAYHFTQGHRNALFTY